MLLLMNLSSTQYRSVQCALYLKCRTVMLFTGAEEHAQDMLQSEDVLTDDKVDKNDEAHETCAVETTDADDDNDEFVEWNEGDGNVDFFHSVYANC